MSMKDLQDKCTTNARTLTILNSLAGPNGQLRASVAKGQGIKIHGYNLGNTIMRDGRKLADHIIDAMDEAAECQAERCEELLGVMEVANKVVAGLMPTEG